ncbi:MAG: tetratricopeptide (TPR) repeat protein, partial [Alteromonadaceae bacterium]
MKAKITEAFVIGDLDTAIYRDKKTGLKAMRLDGNKTVDCSHNIDLLLQSHAEKRYLVNLPKSEKDLEKTLRYWSQRHFLLKAMVSGMDAVCSDETRLYCLAEAALLLKDKALAHFAYSRLLGCPLPETADLTHAITLAEKHLDVHSIYSQLEQVKTQIPKVLSTLNELLNHEAKCKEEPDEILRTFVDAGVVADAAIALHTNDLSKAEELLFTYGRTVQPKQVLTQFIKKLETTYFTDVLNLNKTAEQIVVKDENENEYEEPDASFTNEIAQEISQWRNGTLARQKSNTRLKASEIFAQVNIHKDSILQNLKLGKIQWVKDELLALIKFQHQTGELQHLCKSLCDLAARITTLGYQDFALEVYGYANQTDALDPVTATGYAQTLRSMGRFDDALAAYEGAKARFSDNAVTVTGYAETLRSMGRLDDALAAYE